MFSSIDVERHRLIIWLQELHMAYRRNEIEMARELAQRIITHHDKIVFAFGNCSSLIKIAREAKEILDNLPSQEIGFGPYEGA
jgi:hypothetical protein